MEHSTLVDNTPGDDLAMKNRFESFKFGKGLPSQFSGSKQRHARSHSRNHSVSSSISSLSVSTSSTATMKSSTPAPNDLSSFFPRNEPQATSTSHTLNPAPKRNSHHRRKSSVSTRRESAELMGVSLPDLPQCSSENNINLGEKDSIRRRALLALEGKPDLSTPKVEIPELSTPDIEKMMFDFATNKSSFSTGSSASFGSSLGTSLGGKRDSFKLLASSNANKDQLGVLIEEEEEEEEEPHHQRDVEVQDSLPSPVYSVTEASVEEAYVPVAPVVAVTKPTPTRPRPATLNLKPLALTPESLITSVQVLPTPSPTPSPRPGLRSLTLGSLGGDESVGSCSSTSSRRNSIVMSPTPSNRRPSLNLEFKRCESPAEEKSARRSSISYRSSHNPITSLTGLPTPEMTPTFAKDRRFSAGTDSVTSPSDDGFFPSPPAAQFSRPLSASEQHFLFKSHNALLARITDLERALSMQRRQSSGGVSFGTASRRESLMSVSTENSDLGSDDEMLRLIADLKAERDELKRDVDGWRNRVADMEKQLGIVTKRIETERRDAWVARSRVGLLDAEKTLLEKRLEGVERMFRDLEGEKRTLESENRDLKEATAEKDNEIEELRKSLARAREELNHERELRKQAEREATDAIRHYTLNATRKRVPAFTSIDSSSSLTDVEIDSSDNSFNKFGFPLKAVQEEDDNASEEEDDNDLAGYEDEEDEDEDIFNDSSSSFDSMDRYPRSAGHLQINVPFTPPSQMSGGTTPTLASRSDSPDTSADTSLSSPLPDLPARPTHVSRATLSKTWTFPKVVFQAQESERSVDVDDVDKFFGCLEDSDSTGGESDAAPISPSAYSYERSKSLFASGFKFGDDDEDAPFYLPDNVGTVVEEKGDKRLSIVDEEEEEVEEESSMEEDDSMMFSNTSGITITFTPADDEDYQEQSSENQIVITTPSKVDLPPTLPDFNFDDSDDSDEDSAVPFNFGRLCKSASSRSDVCSSDDNENSFSSPRMPEVPMVTVTPPSSIPRPASPRITSSIPRAIVSRSISDVFTSSPPRNSPSSLSRVSSAPATSSSTYVTPPTKRGGSSTSFIPQAICSPSPVRVVSSSIPKAKPILASTFVRQPLRKSLVGPGIKNSNRVGGSVANVNSPTNVRPLHRSHDHSTATQKQTSEMKSIDLSHSNPNDPFSVQSSRDECTKAPSTSEGASSFSIFSSPVSSRLSLQTLTNFIPLSWNSMAASAVNRVAPTALSISGSSESMVADGSYTLASSNARVNERRYVSREKQLERLRNRLESEGKATARASVNIQCRDCVDHGFVEL